ncbi:hypothetical protein LCGC14_1600410 [marine sediment metagenome]|uniref:Uncharacterized protein n=1 Tax=marine sediment metagenome TaxID=412755 RepID=A0A0F9IXU3_9ZZZZ
MAGARERKRDFHIEPSDHRNGHWRLMIGSYRNGSQGAVFLMSDEEVDDLCRLLFGAETSDRTLGENRRVC